MRREILKLYLKHRVKIGIKVDELLGPYFFGSQQHVDDDLTADAGFNDDKVRQGCLCFGPAFTLPHCFKDHPPEWFCLLVLVNLALIDLAIAVAALRTVYLFIRKRYVMSLM